MKVFIEYPTDKVGKTKLEDAMAEIHAVLTIQKIEKLNLDSQSKKRILKKVMDYIKNEDKKIKFFVRV